MRYFPVFVDLAGARVVVVGGGEEAVRKIRLLLKTDAALAVVAPALHPELEASSRIQWVAKAYDAAVLNGAALVCVAEPALGERVSADAKARNIPVNVVDQAELSTFIVPSIVDRDPVVVAIGTEGAAPVLAQSLRGTVEALLPQGLGGLAARARALRAVVAEAVPAGWQRRAFWRTFFFGAPREALLSGDAVAYELAVSDALYHAGRPVDGRSDVVTLTSPDPELLTLRAHGLLQEADVIVHAEDMPTRILDLARRDAVRKAVGANSDDTVRACVAKGLRVVDLRMAVAARPAAAPFPERDDIRNAILEAVS